MHYTPRESNIPKDNLIYPKTAQSLLIPHHHQWYSCLRFRVKHFWHTYALNLNESDGGGGIIEISPPPPSSWWGWWWWWSHHHLCLKLWPHTALGIQPKTSSKTMKIAIFHFLKRAERAHKRAQLIFVFGIEFFEYHRWFLHLEWIKNIKNS